MRRVVSKAVGEELRRAREGLGLSRAQFVACLPSGIGERTVLAYEHGLRELAILRLLELCVSLGVDPLGVLSCALQRAGVLLENIELRVDLHALVRNQNRTFRPMHSWARNKLNRSPDGVTRLSPKAAEELADFIGCTRDELVSHLARFTPDVGEVRA